MCHDAPWHPGAVGVEFRGRTRERRIGAVCGWRLKFGQISSRSGHCYTVFRRALQQGAFAGANTLQRKSGISKMPLLNRVENPYLFPVFIHFLF